MSIEYKQVPGRLPGIMWPKGSALVLKDGKLVPLTPETCFSTHGASGYAAGSHLNEEGNMICGVCGYTIENPCPSGYDAEGRPKYGHVSGGQQKKSSPSSAIVGFIGRVLYELGRRMLGIVSWDQPWATADDPRMVAYWRRRIQQGRA